MLRTLKHYLRRLFQRANIVANSTAENMASNQQIIGLKGYQGTRKMCPQDSDQPPIFWTYQRVDNPAHEPRVPKMPKIMCPQCALKIDHKTVKNRGRVVGHGGFLSSFYFES